MSKKTCKRGELNALATKCVGGSTDLYFVTMNGGVTAIFISGKDATAYASTLPGSVVVEGAQGDVWGNAKYNHEQRVAEGLD